MLTALTEKPLFSTAKPSEAHLRHVQRRKPSCEFAQPLCLRSIAPATRAHGSRLPVFHPLKAAQTLQAYASEQGADSARTNIDSDTLSTKDCRFILDTPRSQLFRIIGGVIIRSRHHLQVTARSHVFAQTTPRPKLRLSRCSFKFCIVLLNTQCEEVPMK